MKKNEKTTRAFDEGVIAGIAAARGWATPHVGAAYGWAKPRWDRGFETATPRIQESVRRAATGLSGGIATVSPIIQERLDRVGPRITQVIDQTTPRVQETVGKAGPAIVMARGKVVDDYIPALSYKLGEAADSASRSVAGATVPPSVTSAVTRMTGNKKAVRNAQRALAAAAMQASKDLKKRQKRRSGSKVWLILGIIAAAATAGVAAWRASKPVEDPWKTPAPVKPAPVVETVDSPAVVVVEDDTTATPTAPKPAATETTDKAKHAAPPKDATS